MKNTNPIMNLNEFSYIERRIYNDYRINFIINTYCSWYNSIECYRNYNLDTITYNNNSIRLNYILYYHKENILQKKEEIGYKS